MIATLTPAPVIPAVCQPAAPVDPTSSPATDSGTGRAGGATYRTPGCCTTARRDCGCTSAWTQEPAPTSTVPPTARTAAAAAAADVPMTTTRTPAGSTASPSCRARVAAAPAPWV